MHTVNRKDLSERDIWTKFITPALTAYRWDIDSQERVPVYLTYRQIIFRGRMARRVGRRFADRVLYHKSTIFIAAMGANRNRNDPGDHLNPRGA